MRATLGLDRSPIGHIDPARETGSHRSGNRSFPPAAGLRATHDALFDALTLNGQRMIATDDPRFCQRGATRPAAVATRGVWALPMSISAAGTDTAMALVVFKGQRLLMTAEGVS